MSKPPPVIHRDIKPQNIILSDDGLATLIDFGISRYYDKNARSDTVCFGTQEFAPPEQYGFSQTDCRADIFSLGVLLGWMLTGRTSDFVIPDRRLARIVKKCTAFSPKDRYSSVAAVRRALVNADGHLEKAAARTAAACRIFAGASCGRLRTWAVYGSAPAAVLPGERNGNFGSCAGKRRPRKTGT